MAGIGVMIEGQDGLNWERWRHICEDAERLGFASLRRSDHLFSVMNVEGRDALDCWTSLALAAEWTRRIELGPMVSPLTWHYPAVLARQAVAIDVLSNGRFILGVGAGWHEVEHERFGVAFPTLKQRMDNYERGLQLIKRAWERTLPKPVRDGRIPLLLGGGGGEKRGLRIVAEYADEWNLTNADTEIYEHKLGVFLRYCEDAGRDPGSVKRSIMQGYLIGATENEVLERAARMKEVIPRLKALDPRQVVEERSKMWFVGTPEQIAEKMRGFVKLGVELFMLQHFLQDDREGLELLASVQPMIASL
jgi:alkanesulfonate monooxygenase SsuD/methylene tetrahydromethanopterin reductase-like flavin-dependent oxidoreductase (luciferase family)